MRLVAGHEPSVEILFFGSKLSKRVLKLNSTCNSASETLLHLVVELLFRRSGAVVARVSTATDQHITPVVVWQHGSCRRRAAYVWSLGMNIRWQFVFLEANFQNEF